MERDGNANGEVDKKAPPNTQANQIYKELKIKPVKNSEGSIDLGDQNKQNEQQVNKSRPSSSANKSQQQISNLQQSGSKKKSYYQDMSQQKKSKFSSACLQTFLGSRKLEAIVILLEIVYAILVFIYFALDNKQYKDDENIQSTLDVIRIVELIILISLLVKLFFRTIAFGFIKTISDVWVSFDASLIVIIIALLFIDMGVSGDSYETVSKVIKSILRFLRLTLLFKKINQLKLCGDASSKTNFQAPIEFILDILRYLKENVEENLDILHLDWCIEMVSNTDKLYQPIFEGGNSEDAQKWIKNYSEKVNLQSKKRIQLARKTRILESETHIEIKKRIENFQQISIPDEYMSQLKNVDNNDFDVFEYFGKQLGYELPYLVQYLLQKCKLFESKEIDPRVVFDFTIQLQQGYRNNRYHNVIHACDAIQTCHFFLQTCNFASLSKLNPFEIATTYLAAAAHDFEHPGFTNQYLISTMSELAIKYNDRSPLENHHVSKIFFILKEDKYNFLINLPAADTKLFRERLISMILTTDNSQHFVLLAKLKGRLAAKDFDPIEKDKAMCFDLILHAADISNPFKPFHIYEQWTHRILDEFANQGDSERELGLQISYLCDKYTTNRAQCQIGFIEYFVKPYYESMAEIMPELKRYMANFDENKNEWTLQIDKYKKILEDMNAQNKKEEEQALKE